MELEECPQLNGAAGQLQPQLTSWVRASQGGAGTLASGGSWGCSSLLAGFRGGCCPGGAFWGSMGRLWGRVHYKGSLAWPRYFRVAYADGSEEDGLTYTRLTTGKGYTLKDESALPPAGVVVPTAGDVPVQ